MAPSSPLQPASLDALLSPSMPSRRCPAIETIGRRDPRDHSANRVRAYQKSEIIFEEESSGNEMFVVIRGAVSITQTDAGGEAVLSTLGPGELFGEMSLVDFAPRSATAKAVEENTQVLLLDQPRFVYLVCHQPIFALTVMRVLSERIRALEERCQAPHRERRDHR